MSRLQVPPNCDLTLGMVVTEKSVPGTTTWRMRSDERFANPAGFVQGGFLAAFCDSAMGASAVTYARANSSEGLAVANAELKSSFLRPVRPGEDLRCEATVVSGGARVLFCEATVRNERGEVVVRASSTYVIGRGA